jgi:hypothetical protein
MKKFAVFLLLMIAFGFTGIIPCALSKDLVQHGSWEITATVEIPGMPVGMPAQSYTTCLTESNPVPADHESNDCKLGQMKRNGNTVTWTSTCTDENGVQIDSQGEITYHGDTFEGGVIMIVRQTDGATMQMKNTMKGKYLGPCTQ